MGADGTVLLDVERDTFFRLDADQTVVLLELLEREETPEGQRLAFAKLLCERGLLERKHDEPREPFRLDVPEVTAELLRWEDMTTPEVRAHHVVNFLRAWWRASRLVRRGRFLAAVERVRRRHRSVRTAFDIEKARALLTVYYHIRVWAFGKKGRCLLDSLTLLEFLARYDLHCTWVIGVQIRPFASHSWVQHEHYVLNGTVTFVRAYSPILAV